jgi:hypothetical protein
MRVPAGRFVMLCSIAALVLNAPVWLAGLQVRPTPATQTPKRNPKMSNAVIATFPNEPAVLSGQSLIVRTILDNRGSTDMESPSREIPSQFQYILRSQKENGPSYGLSQSATDRRRSPDRFSLPPFQPETLPGGQKFEWLEDIADFWNEGFEPGKYTLIARYDRAAMESPKSVVSVLPLVVESFSSAVSEDHLSSVVAHRRQDGQITLLQRESQVLDPREGVFLFRHLLPKGNAVAVATAIDVVPAGNGRWFAWTRDSKLTASVGLGARVLLTTKPVTAPGTLLSPGFQIGVGTALFGVVSSKGRLDTYLANSSGMKKHWSADLAGAGDKVRWNAQPDGSITVAWEELTTGRILRQSFHSDGRAKEDTPSSASPGRPTAWGLPAHGAPAIWMVVTDGSGLVLARIAANGNRSVARLPGLPGATAWDFLEPASGMAGVMATTEGLIRTTGLKNPRWQTVHEGPSGQQAHVVSLNGNALWAEWIEPGFGVRRAKLP